jgi:hypothetical protein
MKGYGTNSILVTTDKEISVLHHEELEICHFSETAHPRKIIYSQSSLYEDSH